MRRLPFRKMLLACCSFGFVFLALSLWLHQYFGIAPASEQVVVNGEPIAVDWEVVPWASDRTGIDREHRFLTSADGWDGRGKIAIDQELMTISYSDYLGNSAYGAKALLQGYRHQDWSSYIISPTVVGGGIVDGATRFDFAFDEPARRLRVDITQHVNSQRLAKQASVMFVHDGTQFILASTHK